MHGCRRGAGPTPPINLPNRLTLLRFGLGVTFLTCLVNSQYTQWLLTALCVFVAAGFTDLYDGLLARRYGMETDFGRFMDPLADKIITMTAFVYFVQIPELAWPAWLVVTLLARELAVSGLRTLAARRERVLAAATSGKYKTAVQMTGIGVVLLGLIFFRSGFVAREWLNGVSWTTMFLILILTIYSGVEYYYQNWPIVRRSSRT